MQSGGRLCGEDVQLAAGRLRQRPEIGRDDSARHDTSANAVDHAPAKGAPKPKPAPGRGQKTLSYASKLSCTTKGKVNGPGAVAFVLHFTDGRATTLSGFTVHSPDPSNPTIPYIGTLSSRDGTHRYEVDLDFRGTGNC